MKHLLLQVFVALTIAGVVQGAQPAQISLGKPYQKVLSPSHTFSTAPVCIMVPFTVTNNTTGRISFSCSGDRAPIFHQYMLDPKKGKRWDDVTLNGACGLGHTTKTLAPGETLKGEEPVQSEYSGRQLRFMLNVTNESSESHAPVRVKSDSIILP